MTLFSGAETWTLCFLYSGSCFFLVFWVSFFPCVPLVSQVVPLQAMQYQGLLRLLLPFSHHFPPCISLCLHRDTLSSWSHVFTQWRVLKNSDFFFSNTCPSSLAISQVSSCSSAIPGLPSPPLSSRSLEQLFHASWSVVHIPSHCTVLCTHSAQFLWTWQSLYTQFHCAHDVAPVLPFVSCVPGVMLVCWPGAPMAGPGCPLHKHIVGAVCEQCLPVLLKGPWHTWPDLPVAVQSILAVCFEIFQERQNVICSVWQWDFLALRSSQNRGDLHVFLSPLWCQIPCLYLAFHFLPSARMPLAVPGYIQPFGIHAGILVRLVATCLFSTCYEDLGIGWGWSLG